MTSRSWVLPALAVLLSAKQLTNVLVTAVQELRRENQGLREDVERQRHETAVLRGALCRAGLLAGGCE